MTAIGSMVRYLMDAKPWTPDREPRRSKRCSRCEIEKAWNQFSFGAICKECRRGKRAR